LDLNKLEKVVNLEPKKDTEGEVHINIVKYETIKLMIEVLMDEVSDGIDEKIGTQSNELTIPFKLAFNTLLHNKILNKF
jgi:hypothetical protein